MIRRQWIIKTRGWSTTLVELLSPLLLLSLLVWGFTKTTETHFEHRIYANETLELLDPLLSDPQASLRHLVRCVADAEGANGTGGGLLPPDLLDRLDANATLGNLTRLNVTSMSDQQRLRVVESLLAASYMSGRGDQAIARLAGIVLRCANQSGSAVNTLRTILANNGPTPVPDFDTFVLMHKVLKASLESQEGAMKRIERIQKHFGNVLGNLVQLGKIAMAPDSADVRQIAHRMSVRHQYFDEVFIGTFHDEKAAVNYALGEGSGTLWAMVVFHQLDLEGGILDYSLRMNFTTVPRTYIKVDKWHHDLNDDYKRYFTSGFLSIQRALEGLVMPRKGEALLPEEVWAVPFPTPDYSANVFYTAAGPLIGLVMCLSTVYPLGVFIKSLVEEKESRAKETMKIMGLKGWVYLATWPITYGVIFTLISLFSAVLLSASIFPRSNPLVLFLLLLLFTLSEIPFGYLVSVFFSKAKLAAIVGPLMQFAAIMPRYIFFRSSSGQALPGKQAACMLSPTAFTFGADLVAQYEGANLGVTWGNLNESEFPLAKIMWLLFLDIIFYTALTCYLDKVLPSEYGTQLSPWFPLSPSYWRGVVQNTKAAVAAHGANQPSQRRGSPLSLPGTAPHRAVNSAVSSPSSSSSLPISSPAIHVGPEEVARRAAFWDSTSAQPEEPPVDSEEGDCPVQRMPEGLAVAVQISDLHKTYHGGGGKVALDGVSLSIFEGQVTALLGHNGAGKSTAISILTGLLAPSKGTCTILGADIRHEMDAIRRVIGVCPQTNTLFDQLSVREHLELFAALKGVPRDRLGAEVEEMIAKVGLGDKAGCLAHSLSGGMKRKLQVAIALIGGSSVVFLDEPTSGMDPHSRRAMWDLLRGLKGTGKAIILTTHYLDEADLLCDRIAILSEGKLRCCGNPLFLKTRYGIGYTLTVVMAQLDADASNVDAMVLRHVPDAIRLDGYGGEIPFRLPFASLPRFAALFREMEAVSHVMGIAKFGITMTTLEDVFLRLSNESSSTVKAPHVSSMHSAGMGDPGGVDPQGMEEGEQQQLLGPGATPARGPSKASRVAGGGHAGNRAPGLAGDMGTAKGGTSYGDRGSSRGNTTATQQLYNRGVNGKGVDSESSAVGVDESDSAAIRSTGPNGGGSPARPAPRAGAQRSFGRSLRELLRKRALIACRDIKGFLNTALLPVIVVAFVLLILKLDIDPVGPSLALNMGMYITKSTPPSVAPLAGKEFVAVQRILANATATRNGTSGAAPSLPRGNSNADNPRPSPGYGDGPYPGSLLPLKRMSLWRVPAQVSDSFGMSELLLGRAEQHQAPMYAALVYNDTLYQRYNFSLLVDAVADVLNETTSQINMTTLGGGYSNYGGYGGYYNYDYGVPLPQELANQLYNVIPPWQLNEQMYYAWANTEEAVHSPRWKGEGGMGLRAPLCILFNASSFHALPAVMAELASIDYQGYMHNPDASIVVRSHPLPLTESEALQVQSVLTFMSALFVLIPFCYLSASFAVFVVKERAVKAKHVQLVSGAGVMAYWLATYLWDMLIFVTIAVASLIVFLIYEDVAFVGTASKAAGTFLIMVLFGASAIPLTYLYSFGFADHAASQVAIAGVNFVTGFAMVVASGIMGSLDDTRELNAVLIHFYRLFPQFNLGEGLAAMGLLEVASAFRGTNGGEFKWEVLGRPLTLMAVESVAYFLLVVVVDGGLKRAVHVARSAVAAAGHSVRHRLSLGLSRLAVSDNSMQRSSIFGGGGFGDDDDVELDEDVAREKERVEGGGASDDAVVLRNLHKVYHGRGIKGGSKVAVHDLCLGVPLGECFGLLGVNGAGKTTALSILTGELLPTSGDAFINGYSITREMPLAQQFIGYCPQFDPLLELMTGREQLYMYARIQGIPEDEVPATVSALIVSVGLEAFADRQSGRYSGGNKRKLSLAIALVGNPAAVFLDEPSSGMDPAARRAMWDTISRTMAGRCALLTTHSMEESEALCGRLGVMVAGRLRCLGTPQHLKSRFGDGYHIDIRTETEAQVPSVVEFFRSALPTAVVKESHCVMVKFWIPLQNVKLSRIFEIIERAKKSLGVIEYSVSQSSLEQVFISFARREQRVSTENDDGAESDTDGGDGDEVHGHGSHA
eukprot:jgi/Mesvir1/23590/Mv18280-RA.1